MAHSVFTLIRKSLDLPDLQIHLQERWGSENANHRELIHQEMALLKKQFQHSISHSPGLGGFIRSENLKVQLGFDIEVTNRIKDPIAKRIANSSAEFDDAPSASSLWCAKEAAFKALKGPLQPEVISDICVGGWSETPSHCETFHLHSKDPRSKFNNTGILCRIQGHTLAFFVFHP